MRPLSRLAALSALFLNACYGAGDGKPPPLEELYFPTGLALDGSRQAQGGENAKPEFLYVANSDFDLQYRSASVISYKLDGLEGMVPRNCNQNSDCGDVEQICDTAGVNGAAPTYYCVDKDTPVPCATGFRDEANLVLYPGRCNPINPISSNLIEDRVGIGAFATDVIWRQSPDGKSSRLFIPVRGDSTLHWIDANKNKDGLDEPGHFFCGQTGGEDDACDALHRAGDNGSDNLDHLRQPPEPYGIDATSDGEFVAVTNQTQGSVSLFRNDWSTSDDAVKLVYILPNLPLAPVALAALPKPKYSDPTLQPTDAFLVAYRSAAQIDLLRVRNDQDVPEEDTSSSKYSRYALLRTGSVQIYSNSTGFDSRGIAIDDQQRQNDYDKCDTQVPDECSTAADPKQCCYRAVHQPNVYVASRAPASLLVGAMTADANYLSGTSELPSFKNSLQLSFGPSRVIVGNVRVAGSANSTHHDDLGRPFDLERRIFIVCFDSRRIFVYDPKLQAFEVTVSTGRGPYALAVDGERGLAYVGHFTDSYLGVISLDKRFPKTYAAIVASIGDPKTPRSSK